MTPEAPDGAQLASLIENFSQLAHRVLADEALFQTLVAQSSDGLLVVGSDGVILYANPAAEQLFHAASGRLVGQPYGYPLPDGEGNEIAVFTPDQRKALAEVRGATLSWDGQPANLLSLRVVGDARVDRESLRRNSERLHAVIGASPLAIVALDLGGRVSQWNRAAVRMLGWSEGEMLGQNVERDGESVLATFAQLKEATLHGEVVAGKEYSGLQRKDGSVLDAQVWAVPLRGAKETVSGVLFFVADVTERREAEARIRQVAGQDLLTGLPNRSQFRERLRQALERVKHGDQPPFAVLHLGVDRFRKINHTLGHSRGDELLRELAKRIGEELYDTDIVARTGGDEFSVLLRDIRHVRDSARIAAKLLAAVAQPVYFADSRELYVTASIGIAIHPHDGDDPDTLLRHADSAAARAKEEGGNLTRFYTADLETRAREQLHLESRLHDAAQRGELELHYQPQVETASGRIRGVEALLRWHDEELGNVPPARFIPVAEASGLIVPLGAWVLEQACRQGVAWRAAGLPPLRIAVNISARQLEHPELLTTVATVLEKSGFDPAYLELELTESMLMKNPEEAVGVLENLKRLGVRLSIDDFGTGWSALSHLARLPIDTLKIDRSFVTAIAGEGGGAAIVRAIAALARSLHLSTVAEGVETPAQVEFLRRCGCDEIQGYYFSRPVAAAECTPLLAAGHLFGERRSESGKVPIPAVWRTRRAVAVGLGG